VRKRQTHATNRKHPSHTTQRRAHRWAQTSMIPLSSSNASAIFLARRCSVALCRARWSALGQHAHGHSAASLAAGRLSKLMARRHGNPGMGPAPARAHTPRMAQIASEGTIMKTRGTLQPTRRTEAARAQHPSKGLCPQTPKFPSPGPTRQLGIPHGQTSRVRTPENPRSSPTPIPTCQTQAEVLHKAEGAGWGEARGPARVGSLH
jgi:hypothetical protein